MNTNFRSEIKYSRGQGITEFALILVFLLVLLAGVFDLGRAFFAYMIIRDAAQEGAVYASIAPKSDLGAFYTAVANRVETAYLDPSNPSETPLDINEVTVQVDIIGSGCAAPGNSVKVTVDYEFPLAMPFLGAIIGKQKIEMSAFAEDSILAPICP
ncbi:MAG: hypothetical protein DRI65_00545 [Chloroflexota bacterium]|nr:MAG: hypothetical protein DRI65_00545 [Chloroflexota bacterium]